MMPASGVAYLLHVMRSRISCILLLAVLAPAAEKGGPKIVQEVVFTDERAQVSLAAGGTVAFTQRVLTAQGWGASDQGEAAVVDGKIEVAPLGEGINVVAFAGGGEVRFLAMAPPAALDRSALLRALPRSGAKLLAGEPYAILAMGDSVTDTGDHAGMFARLLARATGNRRIAVTKRAYPGRSADATARNWEGDVAAAGAPDLGLLMYGLNDQVCFVPLDAFLEHYRFVATRLAARGADTVFMQPTPHISIPLSEAERKPDSDPPWFAFRTIAWAEAIRPLADELGVPLAETFAAVWGRGGDGIEASARAMWPVYPPSYSRQFASLVESDGKGDTIHPNALGHYAMARAVLAALAPAPPPAPLSVSGATRWTPTGVRSTITAINRGDAVRSGRFEIHPELRGELEAPSSIPYRLAPGESLAIEVGWPQARRPEDLLAFPNDRYLAPGRPLIPLVDLSDGGSSVRAVPAPFAVPAAFVRERSVCVQPVATVRLATAAGFEPIATPFPDGDVGRVPLLRRVEAGGIGWAVAELAYVRYAGAVRGEATPDGDLGEWTRQVWSPLGEPCQARFATGPADRRQSPEACRMRWSVRAGADGMHLALDVQGEVAKDRFTVFLDPRPAAELGTVGRYYWLSGALKPDGVLVLSPGETSPRGLKPVGRWVAADGRTRLECTVPYALFEQQGWPASGDLGLSLWWVHHGGDGQTTHLQWSEDGHPWNPRWYGVVRLQEVPDPAALPWMVRVR